MSLPYTSRLFLRNEISITKICTYLSPIMRVVEEEILARRDGLEDYYPYNTTPSSDLPVPDAEDGEATSQKRPLYCHSSLMGFPYWSIILLELMFQ